MYKRASVKENIDLTTLKEDEYNPNEPDPEPFDDTASLNLVELEDDTFQLHSSNEETDEIVHSPSGEGTLSSSALDMNTLAHVNVLPPATVDLPAPADPPTTPADLSTTA